MNIVHKKGIVEKADLWYDVHNLEKGGGVMLMGMEPVYFWLIAMVLFIALELPTLGLTTIWFAFGSLTALAVAAVGGPVWLQSVVFILVSLITLFGVRNAAMRYFNKNREQTNVMGLIGKKGIVTEDISNVLAVGQVTVGGQEWMARAVKDDVTYEKGAMVVIRDIQGVKLIVEKE